MCAEPKEPPFYESHPINMHVNKRNQRIWKGIFEKNLRRNMHLSPAWLLCCVRILWFRWLTCVYVRGCGWGVWLVERWVLCFGTHFPYYVEANVLLLTVIFEAVHWCSIIFKFGTFLFTGCWLVKFLFGLVYFFDHVYYNSDFYLRRDTSFSTDIGDTCTA